LIRWKEAENELPKSILGTKLFPKEHSGNHQHRHKPRTASSWCRILKKIVRHGKGLSVADTHKELGLNPKSRAKSQLVAFVYEEEVIRHKPEKWWIIKRSRFSFQIPLPMMT
jgi:hypothetical protein